MTQQPDPADASPALPALKVVEPEVDAEIPWGDDVLDRKEIADRLTTIVRGQEVPFVISLDGRWGTGKTFLLKRWAQDLENQGWQAIYYNAWEDDFASEPLISVTGQLAVHLKKGSYWAKVRKLGSLVAPFVRPVASTASIATTGVPLANVQRRKQQPPSHLADYLEKRAAKDELKQHLADLAAEVRSDTDQPLVFIIDELDRCRPTFAIELLERVKHIFDVPNIVFVFGINRSELTKSLESVYGEIDAGTYLRRFFDMEFALPDADPEQFCRHLVTKFQLGAFFNGVDQRRPTPYYMRQLSEIAQCLPVVLGRMDLSLRDMDYCVRLVALAARESLDNKRLYAPLLVLLAATKLHAPELYRRFVQGDARGADVINHLNAQRALREPRQVASDPGRTLDWLEAAAYFADDPNRALRQLRRIENGETPDEPEYISSRLAALDMGSEENLRRLRDVILMTSGSRRFFEGYESARRSLAEKIDIYYGMTRR